MLSDGTDPVEAAEIALAYAGLGVTRLIVTRLDASRRHGTPLAAASGAGLAFSDCTQSPLIRDGLLPLNPTSLAQLLLPAEDASSTSLKTGT